MGVAAYCQERWNEKLPCKNIHEPRLLILSIESLYEVRRGCYTDLASAAIAKKKGESIIVTSGFYYDVKNDPISKNPSVLNGMQVMLIF
jgi:hypothetical protein